MANFRKSFNFRNGVQVDEDNFIVNSSGLVGIGTSVPTEFLDVRGSAKVVGLATIQDAFIGVATITNNLKVGITSFSSGIVTATSTSGIVTYYGDARFLQGMPTSQWVDVDAGLGYTSIYAAGNVGVGTNDPRFTFQVGGNNDTSNFSRGVGISSVGDVRVAGILTATQFYGWGIGVTGINANYIVTGTLDNDRLPSTISISDGLVSKTLVTGPINSSGISVTGVITASNGFVGNLTGTATTASSLTGTPSIVISNLVSGIITATKLIADTIEVPSIGITTISKLLHVGTGGTAFSALESGRIGVGTAIPTKSIQVREASDAAVEIISEVGESKIIIGQQVLPTVGAGDSSAILRFGNTDKTLDILNSDTGNFNQYLHSGSAGIDTGRFNWIYGQTNLELMSLTYGGRLGVGKTNPDHPLHVVGTSTITGNSFFGGNVSIAGSITGIFNFPAVIDRNIYSSTGVSTFYNLNVSSNIILSSGASIGINTNTPIAEIDVRGGEGLFAKIGINTNSFQQEVLNVVGAAVFEGIGIGTSASTYGGGILLTKEFEQRGSISYFYDSIVYVSGSSGVGVGTTSVRAALDFADAGKTNPGLLPGEGTGSRAFMLPPRLTTTQRVGLATQSGAIIYNTSTNKHQGYNGTSWNDLY